MLTETAPSGGLLLASLKQRLPKQTFDTWFRSLTIDASPSKGVFTFAAPNSVVKEWVVRHYADMISQMLGELSLGHYKIEWSAAYTAKNELSKESTPTTSTAGQKMSPHEVEVEQVDEVAAF